MFYRVPFSLILILFSLFACVGSLPVNKVHVDINNGSCEKGNCSDGVGVFEFNDGSRYAGEFKLSEPHGNGVKIWSNGDRYDGGFKFGKRHGLGRMFSKNGQMIEKLWYLDRDAISAKRELEAKKYSEIVQGNGDDGFQWGKFLALATGAAIGGLDNLATEEQINILSGMAADSMNDVSGVNHLQSSADQIMSSKTNSSNPERGLDQSIGSLNSSSLSIVCMGRGACAEYTLTTQADLRKFTASCPEKLSGSCPKGPACRHTTSARSVVTYSYNQTKEMVHEACLSSNGEIVE